MIALACKRLCLIGLFVSVPVFAANNERLGKMVNHVRTMMNSSRTTMDLLKQFPQNEMTLKLAGYHYQKNALDLEVPAIPNSTQPWLLMVGEHLVDFSKIGNDIVIINETPIKDIRKRKPSDIHARVVEIVRRSKAPKGKTAFWKIEVLPAAHADPRAPSNPEEQAVPVVDSVFGVLAYAADCYSDLAKEDPLDCPYNTLGAQVITRMSTSSYFVRSYTCDQSGRVTSMVVGNRSLSVINDSYKFQYDASGLARIELRGDGVPEPRTFVLKEGLITERSYLSGSTKKMMKLKEPAALDQALTGSEDFPWTRFTACACSSCKDMVDDYLKKNPGPAAQSETATR